MLTASVILQCICIVIVEAFNHNSITTKNIFSIQVLITLSHSPSSLNSVSLISLSLLLSYSLPSLTHSMPSLPSLTQSLLCHTHSPYSIILSSYFSYTVAYHSSLTTASTFLMHAAICYAIHIHISSHMSRSTTWCTCTLF